MLWSRLGRAVAKRSLDCIRRLAENGVPPSEIDEKTLESCLTFRYDPDIVVKTGDDHLTDFLISAVGLLRTLLF